MAITDAYASPTVFQDAQQYNTAMHQPKFKPGQFNQILPSSYDQTDACGANGWYGEETLDVEAVHAMAPGAKIVYVGGRDCGSGLDNAWAQTIDRPRSREHHHQLVGATTPTTSTCPGQSYVDFYNQFALEAALTGITVNFSSGDSGDQTNGGTDLATKSVASLSRRPGPHWRRWHLSRRRPEERAQGVGGTARRTRTSP